MFHYKVGFIGAGNMAQAIIKGLVESKTITPNLIYASNRTPGKLQKLKELWQINTVANNEEIVDLCDIVIIAVKPQDLSTAVDSLVSSFTDKQVVISLVAGVELSTLQKKIRGCRIVKVMPNTPAIIKRGVTGYLTNEKDPGLQAIVEDLFSPLGYVTRVEDEEQFEALMVSCSSGTGFVFELMTYFQEWIEERGFSPESARKMVVETFAGASLLAAHQTEVGLEELQNKVASKKGVTAAGLESMRELEVERLLRYSFEKAALRNRELAKQG